MESEDKYIGKQIGNYRIISRLDSGSFGRVYRGVHLYLANRAVAIKVLHLTYLGSPQERESFLQEAQFLEMLKHPHILPMYDVGIDEGFPYLVAEFAPNGSLRDHIQRHHTNILPLDEVLTILTQVGEALQYVHLQNIVHRDLKPENILFNARGEALIADFGIAVFLETTKTKNVDVIGSPPYMAPEQFEGFASRRSDQYALACMTYELLTGRPPFMAAHAVAIGMKHQNEKPVPPTYLNPKVPAHVERAILRALAKHRDDRYPDVPSFIAALLNAPARSPQRTKEQWLDEGNRLFNLHRYGEALLAFERGAQLDPQFADAHEARGSALYALAHYELALAAYEQAIRLDPNYASAVYGKANVLYYLKRYQEALIFYEWAIQLDPQLADAYMGKGNTLYYLERYEEALDAYERALQLDPQCVGAYDGKGWALRQLQRYEEALEPSERAIQLDPNNASPYSGKGRTLFRIGRYEEALSFIDQAIQRDPKLARSYEYKGDTLYALKRYEDALYAYERVIQLQPKSVVAYHRKGNALKQLGRLEEAQKAYEKARQLGYRA